MIASRATPTRHRPWSLSCLLLVGLCFGSLALAQSSSLSILDRQARPVPLPIDQAFPFYVSQLDDRGLQITWTPASGHYLYRHAFAFALQRGEREPSALDYEMPEGLRKTDQFFGDIEAFYAPVSATLEIPASARAGDLLWIEFQGCAEWGFCYPPQRLSWEVPPESPQSDDNG